MKKLITLSAALLLAACSSAGDDQQQPVHVFEAPVGVDQAMPQCPKGTSTVIVCDGIWPRVTHCEVHCMPDTVDPQSISTSPSRTDP
jgi:hypothetical protein